MQDTYTHNVNITVIYVLHIALSHFCRDSLAVSMPSLEAKMGTLGPHGIPLDFLLMEE